MQITQPTRNPTTNPSEPPIIISSGSPSNSPSDSPIIRPSFQPTNHPSTPPSKSPSHIPSQSPSGIPSEPPTMNPSLQPTIEDHFVGDYKISARTSSHGNWLLCDGSFIDSTNYPQLFDIIGYSFGSFAGYPLLFQLPNVSDHVVGINGNLNSIGTVVGSEQVTLTEDNLPSHWHYLASFDSCGNGVYDIDTNPYLAWDCKESIWIAPSDAYYSFRQINTAPNRYKSGTVGNGTSVNIMQPTIFVGNLFIYAG